MHIYDMGDNKEAAARAPVYGSGTDIDTGLPMGNLSLNVYAKYQWQNSRCRDENQWDGYRFKVKYFVPISDLWGGKLAISVHQILDWGSIG
ncbi:outer membrane protein OmpK [Shigella flexneri]